MSKVIKAHQLIVDRTIRLEKNGERSYEDLIPVKDEAEKIINETETMVKQLLQDAEEQADIIIQQANDEAQQIIQNAESDAGNINNKAYREGYDKGLADVKAKAEREYKKIILEANTLLNKAKESEKQALINAEQDIVKLAVAIAEKLVQQQIELNPATITAIIGHVLQKAKPEVWDSIVIHVNEQNVVKVKEKVNSGILAISEESVKILSDPSLGLADCIVATPKGYFEFSIDEQLNKIEQVLKEEI